MVEVLLLGPVAARDDRGAAVDVGARARRTVLAALAEDAGKVVSMDALIERLWGDGPPATATNIVQGYVAKLRQVLGEAIETRPPGYVLHAVTDLGRFDELTRRAEAAPPPEARMLLDEALSLWRGDFASDVGSWRAPYWEERRVAAVESRIEADLSLSPSAALVADLEYLIERYPWRERLRAQLAWALHRLGRRTEALRCLRAARAQLAEAGLEAGPLILDVERRLFADEHLDGSVDGAVSALGDDFIGRETYLAALMAILDRSNLLTIIGPGGAGKTSVARELGRRLGGPLWFVDLVTVDEPSLVPAAAAAALGAGERADVDLGTTLESWSRDHAGTVILDNCEHVLEQAADVATRLARGGDGGAARVVATSREPLRIRGEVVHRLGPMDAADARQLFRARLVAAGGDDPDEDDEVINRVCRRLDHLPLALELAAARAASLGTANVDRRLDDRFALLDSEPDRRSDGRHSSLRSLLDWSIELLGDDEIAALRRLSVFAGPFSLDAAERVAATEARTLARLVDKSLVHREGLQFRLLETIQHYAAELLAASGEHEELRGAHLAWCAALEVLDEAVDAEVRAALDRARHASPSATAADLARRAATSALARRLLTEAVARAEVAVEVAPDDIGRGESAVLLGEIWASRWRGDLAIEAFREAIAAFLRAGREDLAATPRALVAEVMLRFPATVTNPIALGDVAELVSAGLEVEDRIDAAVASQLWSAEAYLAYERQEWDAAESAGHRAVGLARKAGDAVVLSGALDAVEAVQLGRDQYGSAASTAEERMTLLHRLPSTARGTLEYSDILAMRSDTALRIGDFAASTTAAERLWAFERDRGLPASGLARLVRARFFVGQWDQAEAETEAMLEGWERDGRPTATYLVLGIGSRAAIRGLRGDSAGMHEDLELARRVFAWRSMHNTWLALAEATVLQATGEPAAAKAILDRVQHMRVGWASLHAAMTAEACAAAGDPAAGEVIAAAEALVDGDRYSMAILLRARGDAEEAAALFAALPCPWQAAASSG